MSPGAEMDYRDWLMARGPRQVFTDHAEVEILRGGASSSWPSWSPAFNRSPPPIPAVSSSHRLPAGLLALLRREGQL